MLSYHSVSVSKYYRILIKQFDKQFLDLNSIQYVLIYPCRISTLDSSLDRNALNEIYKVVDVSNAGFVEISLLHDMLSSRFGKDKSTSKSSSNVIEKAKAKIFERCGDQVGIKGLAR